MTEALPSLGIVTGSVSRRAGGLFNSVRYSALALSDAGVEIDVFSLRDPFTREDVAAWKPLAPVIDDPVGPNALGHVPGLSKKLVDGGYDVVHQHGIWQAFSMQVSNWHRQTGKPYMVSPRGMLDPWALRNAAWKKQITGALYQARHLRNATCLHALNRSEADSIRALDYQQPIAIIPNGADMPAGPVPEAPEWWPSTKVLLFIGRIHPKKGILELLDAWAMLDGSIVSDWSLVIAGWDDGGHEVEIRKRIAERSLDDRVILPGALYGDDKRAALSHAAAFVLPSFSEGLPMSVLEAWSHELPVLMTRACNLPEGFDAGAALEISTDREALASQLSSALSLPGERLSEIGQRGQALVEARFGWPSIAAQHLDVYRWMVAGCPPGDRPDCII